MVAASTENKELEVTVVEAPAVLMTEDADVVEVASETGVVLPTLPQFTSRTARSATVSMLVMGLFRFLSTLQLFTSVVVLKTTPTQVPAPWFLLTVSQRDAQSAASTLVIQLPRKLPSAYD